MTELSQAERTALREAMRSPGSGRFGETVWLAARDFGRERERALEQRLREAIAFLEGFVAEWLDDLGADEELKAGVATRVEFYNLLLAVSPGEPEGQSLVKALRFYADSYRYVGGNGGFPSDIDRDAGQCAREALAESKGQCDHEFQMHPQSEDFGVCSHCGASQPDHGPGEPSDTPVHVLAGGKGAREGDCRHLSVRDGDLWERMTAGERAAYDLGGTDAILRTSAGVGESNE